jgi:hypothetical protein
VDSGRLLSLVADAYTSSLYIMTSNGVYRGSYTNLFEPSLVYTFPGGDKASLLTGRLAVDSLGQTVWCSAANDQGYSTLYEIPIVSTRSDSSSSSSISGSSSDGSGKKALKSIQHHKLSESSSLIRSLIFDPRDHDSLLYSLLRPPGSTIYPFASCIMRMSIASRDSQRVDLTPFEILDILVIDTNDDQLFFFHSTTTAGCPIVQLGMMIPSLLPDAVGQQMSTSQLASTSILVADWNIDSVDPIRSSLKTDYAGKRLLIYCTSLAIYKLDITDIDSITTAAIVIYRASNPNANLGSLVLDATHRRLYFRDFSYYATRSYSHSPSYIHIIYYVDWLLTQGLARIGSE